MNRTGPCLSTPAIADFHRHRAAKGCQQSLTAEWSTLTNIQELPFTKWSWQPWTPQHWNNSSQHVWCSMSGTGTVQDPNNTRATRPCFMSPVRTLEKNKSSTVMSCTGLAALDSCLVYFFCWWISCSGRVACAHWTSVSARSTNFD